MRWRFAPIDDMTPQLDLCCGLEPQAVYGPTSTITCSRCKEKISVETAPFFRDPIRQREHETWRAVLAWNGRT